MESLRVLKGEQFDYFISLIFLSGFCCFLILARFLIANNYDYWFMPWNLLLAWIPLIFSWYLYNKTAKSSLVLNGVNLVLFIIWLLFLPNAFYLITDYIHLYEYGGINITYDIVMLGAFTFAGIIIGYTSLWLVHKRTVQKIGPKGHWLPILALLASGFAIYLGRELRWNSWDVLFNPFGLLFDLSGMFIEPTKQGLTLLTTLLFFAFLGLIYLSIWRAAELLKK
jgi:uncharacterized membrane protein